MSVISSIPNKKDRRELTTFFFEKQGHLTTPILLNDYADILTYLNILFTIRCSVMAQGWMIKIDSCSIKLSNQQKLVASQKLGKHFFMF